MKRSQKDNFWASGRLSRKREWSMACPSKYIYSKPFVSTNGADRKNKGLLGSTVRCWTIDLDWWLSISSSSCIGQGEKKKDSPHLVDCMACRLQARPTGIITRTREEVSNSRTTRIRIKTCMNKSLKVTCSINQSAAALSKKKKKNWDVQ